MAQEGPQAPLDTGQREPLLKRLMKPFKRPQEAVEETPQEEQRYSYPDNPIPLEIQAPLKCYRVSLPKGHMVDTQEAEKLLHLLAASSSQFSFELVGTRKGIFVQWTAREDAKKLVSLLQAYFPQLAIQELDADLLPFEENGTNAIVDLGLDEEFVRPLATGEGFSSDPFIGVLAAFDALTDGEAAMVQVIFQGVQNAWASSIHSLVSDGEGGSFFVNDKDSLTLGEDKASKPLYAVIVRTIARSHTSDQAARIALDMAEALIATSRSEYNSLIPLSNKHYPMENHIAAVYERASYRLGMILNSSELVHFVHMPSASVASRRLDRQMTKTKPLPEALEYGSYSLGINTHLGKERDALITDEQRLRHMHIIGTTGTGKSTLIANLFLQDCDAGNGCMLLDPHGDLVDDIISRLPPERLEDVILIDPSDMEFPIGFNLMEAKTELEKIFLSSDLVETFREKSTAWGDTMTAVLSSAINAFLYSSKGGTLLELRKFLLDAKFRASFLKTIEDPTIRSYWENDFLQLRKGALAPLLTRLDTFLRPRIVRNMLAQRKGIDFNEVLQKKKIVLVKLAQGLIGEENSFMLGTLILAKVYQAAQARQSIAKEERSSYFLYIDEFHNFMTPSLSAILSGARKYGLGLALAHQELSQIHDSVVGNSVLSNPSIRVCFRVGDMDAQKLEKGFSYFDAHDLQNLGTGQAICRVERSTWDFNVYSDELDNSIYSESNLAFIKDISRNDYAMKLEEVEAIVQELYKTETKQAQTVQATDEQPVQELDLPNDAEKLLPFEAVETIIPIKEAAKKYLETTEKERELREHLYLQTFVKKLAEERGFKVELEAPTKDGGRIDALLIRNELTVAIEISVTNTVEYEVRNITKCINSGYTNIVMLCSNESHLRSIRDAVNNSSIQYLAPEILYKYLDDISTPKQIITENRIRGYRVKAIYNKKE
ncbi:MAG: type IV secretion system DNA-binding domain-containing protein [Sphingobacteriales bacterium JAD_PAG50586_3]|nr:MAG: type IV secretion system DNA-binding domain-containing protein [Sphingobacteriales bacterium JAD_PAG50586_3]